MNFADVKLIYVFVCVVLGMIILSPTLLSVVSFPEGEQFSELYILDSNRKLENMPFNISANAPYTIHLGVGNEMGALESYLVYVKLRNQTDSLPDCATGSPSSLAPIYEYRLFLGDDEVWEREITFSFENVVIEGKINRISGFSINGDLVDVEKVTVWDSEKDGFLYQLVFELWIYNETTSVFEFHNRYVGLKLNMTGSL